VTYSENVVCKRVWIMIGKPPYYSLLKFNALLLLLFADFVDCLVIVTEHKFFFNTKFMLQLFSFNKKLE